MPIPHSKPFTMKAVSITPDVHTPIKIFVLVSFMSLLSPIVFAGSGGGGAVKLEFKNPVLNSGTAGADGAVYKFKDVTGGVDALVKIKGRSSSLVYLVTMDMVTSGFDKAWQPQVGYNNGKTPGAADWWMDFEISFVKNGTTTPITVDEFDLTGIDIDGNGDKIREYITFYGLKSYIIEANSILAITKITSLLNGLLTNIGTKFEGPTQNMKNIDTSGTSVMVTTKYLSTQKFTLRAGAVASGANSATERMYSMYPQNFKFSQPAQSTLPVTLKSFNAKVASSKVQLIWKVSEEVNFSHFIVERSVNGKDFQDATMIFADAHSMDYSYNYSETLNQNASGVIYYRLKMVDRDGEFKYSDIKIVKLNGRNELVTISSFPNPVTSELRITVPSSWQDKKVTYELVNMNGVVIKQQVKDRPSQTETMQVGDIGTGVYIMRLKAGDESAMQQIVKK
jgi:hypothetical protein